MSETTHPTAKSYLMVFVWLCVLTGAEVLVASMKLMEGKALAWFLVITALMKAGLVAAYFMHLKFEGKLIYFIVIVPFILAFIFVFGLFPDIVHSYWIAEK